ncbi:MAG: HEAT repeat domain-containing protein [Polyangiales bacterium]
MRAATAALALVAGAILTGFDWPGSGEDLAASYAQASGEDRAEILHRASAVAATDPAAAALLTRAMREGSVEERAMAARLAGRGRVAAARDAVSALLDDPAEPVRAAATEALGALGGEGALSSLRRVLGDASLAVRLRAIEAVARVGGPDAAIALLDRVHDPERDVRLAAARALGALGDARAVLSLLGALQDPLPEVRVAATVSLGQLRDPRAVRGLVGLLHDPQVEVRVAALRAVGALGASGAEAVDHVAAAYAAAPSANFAAQDEVRVAAIEALSRIGGRAACEALARVVTRGSLVEAQRAVAALGACGDHLGAVVPSMLEGSRETVREQVVEVLGAMGGDAPAAILLDLLARRSNPHTAGGLLRALGRTGSDRALVPLLRAAAGEPTEARGPSRGRCLEGGDALRGLRDWADRRGRMDPAAADPLMAMLAASDPGCLVRIAPLLELLGATENPRVRPTLMALLSHALPDVRAAAAIALRRVPPSDGDDAPLIEALADPMRETREAAADALAAQADARAFTALLRRWGDPRPLDRVAAAREIGRSARRLAGHGVSAALSAATARLSTAAREGSPARRGRARRARRPCRDRRRGGARGPPRRGGREAILRSGGGPRRAARRARRVVSRPRAAPSRGPRRALTAASPRPRATCASRGRGGCLRRGRSASAASARSRTSLTPSKETLRRGQRRGALAESVWEGASFDAAVVSALCASLARPTTPLRVNASVALAAAGARCDGDPFGALLADRDALVRRAAAEATAANLRAHPDGPDAGRDRARLERCAASDPSREVAARCGALRRGDAEAPPRRSAVDVRVVDAEGEPRSAELVWIALPDGRVRVAVTGPDGWVHERPQPEGTFTVHAPER